MDEVTTALVSGAPRAAVGGSGDGRPSRTCSPLTIACGDRWAKCREPQRGGWGRQGLAPRALCPDWMIQSSQARGRGGSRRRRMEEVLQSRANKQNVLCSSHVGSGSFLFPYSQPFLLPFPEEFKPVSSFCTCKHTNTRTHTHDGLCSSSWNGGLRSQPAASGALALLPQLVRFCPY